MLFKNVAISEKSEMHTFFKVGFSCMMVGLVVSLFYLTSLLMKEHNLGFVSSFAVVLIAVYGFYKCALSPNGYLNTYLKLWWYLANGGDKPEIKWYDKVMFAISIALSVTGALAITYIVIIALGFVAAVLC